MTHPSFDIFELPNNAKGSILVPAPGVVCKTIEFYVPVAVDKVVITGTIRDTQSQDLDTQERLGLVHYPFPIAMLPLDDYFVTCDQDSEFPKNRVSFYLAFVYQGKPVAIKDHPELLRFFNVTVIQRFARRAHPVTMREFDNSVPKGYSIARLTQVQRDKLHYQGVNYFVAMPDFSSPALYKSSNTPFNIDELCVHATWLNWMFGYLRLAVKNQNFSIPEICPRVEAAMYELWSALLRDRFFMNEAHIPTIKSNHSMEMEITISTLVRTKHKMTVFFNPQLSSDPAIVVKLSTQFLEMLLSGHKLETIFGPDAKRTDNRLEYFSIIENIRIIKCK